MSLSSLDLWKKLERHRDRIATVPVRQHFADDSTRFERFSIRFDDLLADYSKQRVTTETMALLAELARATGVEAARDRMFAGEAINTTEGRACLLYTSPSPRD